jgi:hypothetical protein
VVVGGGGGTEQISQRSEEYNGFMLGKLRSVGGEVAGHAARENVFRGGQFNCTAREVTGYYITMEEYYVEEMVNKAIELDELVPAPPLSPSPSQLMHVQDIHHVLGLKRHDEP